MSPIERLAWFVGTWMAIAIAATWIKHRLRRPPLPQRTPADVHRDADNYRAARIAEANARANGIPAAPDNTEGMRLDWADECELLWSAPFDPQTGLELLRRDIRKQQREEET